MSCNNSSGIWAFHHPFVRLLRARQQLGGGPHPAPHPVLERQREWQWLWLRQRLLLLTGLHRKSKNGAVVRQLRFLWFHAAKQPVDRDVQNICKGV